MSDTTTELLADEARTASNAGWADTHPLNCHCSECIGDEAA